MGDSREHDAPRASVDAATFETYYRHAFPKIYAYVHYRVGDDEATQDIVSDAFLRAARYFSRFDPERASFTTWVRSIARNCVNDHFARTRAYVALEDVPEILLSHEGGIRSVEERELCRLLLAGLTDEERELVHLKYYLGMRNVDIARELGMNASTVATKLQRALTRMRASAGRDIDL